MLSNRIDGINPIRLVSIIEIKTQHTFVSIAHHRLIEIGGFQVLIAEGLVVHIFPHLVRIKVDDVRTGDTAAETPIEGV